MKKAFLVVFVSMFLGLMLIGCQRDRGVHASNDEYQPRPAPLDRSNPPENRLSQDVQGELARVDLPNKMFVVRVENGMEQTFKFDNDTSVLGLSIEPQPVQPGKRQKPSATTNDAIRNLVGKEGSEVIVQWRTEDGAKMASRVDVTQMSTSKSTSKSKRRHN